MCRTEGKILKSIEFEMKATKISLMPIHQLHILSQIFLIICCGRVQSTSLVPQSYYYGKICNDTNLGTCRCSETNVKCIMLGDTVLVAYHREVDYEFYLQIRCISHPSNINLLGQLPFLDLNKVSKFELTDCLELPDFLNGNNIINKGGITFEKLSVPVIFFRKSRGLQRLELTLDYLVDMLPAQLFLNLTQLNVLVLFYQEPATDFTIPTELFLTLPNLKSLKISIFDPPDEYINNITSAHFRNLHSLKHLDLTKNNLITLCKNIFSTLPRLNYLNLRMNKLATLPPDLLASQHELTVLDLSRNFLEYLPQGLFNHTSMLCKLFLQDNRLSITSNIIANIRSLQYLYELDLSLNQFGTIMGAGAYANETILSSFTHSVASVSQLPVENFKYVFELFSIKKRTEKRHYTSINLSLNNISYFDMDWITVAGLSCLFTINLRFNLIEHVYALTPRLLSNATACNEEVLLEGNPIICDCQFAWIYNNNYRTSVKFPECSRKVAFCDWQPALCPNNCICFIDNTVLQINCSGASLMALTRLPRPEQFSDIGNSMLSISHNRFYELPSNTTLGYANVTQLNASYNQITEILPSQLPPNLTVLDVRNNRLTGLRDDFLLVYLNTNSTLQQLYLAENPWKCDCSGERMLRAVQTFHAQIPDVAQLVCDNRRKQRLLDVDVAGICAFSNPYIVLESCFVVGCLIIFTIIVLYYKYQLQVNVWLYSQKLCLYFINECDLDKDKTFDAFISYAHQEEQFVNQILLPQLENGDPPYRVCTHERNWLAGGYIPEQIVESVAQSRRTIIVLSQHFLASDWGCMEFRTAHQCSLNERRSRIIIIKYGEIKNNELLHRELKAYLDMNTYLTWEDNSWFWSKLRYAMPHKKGEARVAGMLELRRKIYVMGQVESNRMQGACTRI